MLPQTLIDRLRYVEIYTTRAVRNHRAGDYLSRLRGRGFEFDEHKPYQPGDDTRQIDWNVTARMQRPYVKRELEEKELGMIIMVDVSRSMLFTSTNRSKKELALEVAALLAFSAAADNISTGLIAFTDRVECYLPPKRGTLQAWRVIEHLYEQKPRGELTDFELAMEQLNSVLKRAALVFCLSDFLHADAFWSSPQVAGQLHRADFIPVIVEDQWEQELPEVRGFFRMRDLERGDQKVITVSKPERGRYGAMLRERRESLRANFYRLGMDHLVLRTDDDYLKRIMTFLLTRRSKR
ncbi:MAG: hypothetical protein JWO80_1014 [Bryobacterales bacterium]|nr:hypothetical protein [Bryobacterales bacterium]